MSKFDELNDKYGPQTAEIEAVIERLKTMTADEIEALAAAWDAARTVAWDAARTAAWYDVRYDVRDATWGAAWYDVRYDVRDATWGAVRDAILALLVKDLITPEQFDLLYGPWKQVMEGE